MGLLLCQHTSIFHLLVWKLEILLYWKSNNSYRGPVLENQHLKRVLMFMFRQNFSIYQTKLYGFDSLIFVKCLYPGQNYISWSPSATQTKFGLVCCVCLKLESCKMFGGRFILISLASVKSTGWFDLDNT